MEPVKLNSLPGMIYTEYTRSDREPADIRIRVAVYPRGAGPEITEVAAATPRAAAAKFSRFVMEKVAEFGGRVPEVAVREVVENLIHADYKGVVISVLEDGNVVRISDKGPGVRDKDRAMEFGFSGATPEAASVIRGVGAGLGIARQAAAEAGGEISIEDNIGGGTVTTISVSAQAEPRQEVPASTVAKRRYPDGVPRMNITDRQQKVLVTVLEYGEVGPSPVAEKLEISVSTAYRDLSILEEHGLVIADESGKRMVSPLGRDLVAAIVSTWVK